MSGISFRAKIVLDNLEIGIKNVGRMTDWEKDFIGDLTRKIQKGYLKPEKLSQNQFNTLQTVVEGLKR